MLAVKDQIIDGDAGCGHLCHEFAVDQATHRNQGGLSPNRASSLVLFGGMGLWAVISILLINRAEPRWTPPHRGTAAGDLRLVLIAAVAFVVIVGLHMWLGPSPFTGA